MFFNTHCYETMIREHHLDTFGHVNNAVYLSLLEEARWQWIYDNGSSLEEIAASKQGPVILEINIRFKTELRNRTKIRIESQIQSYKSKICTLKQLIFDDRNQICCEADLVIGLFDLKARKLILPTEKWFAALGISEGIQE